MFKGQNVVPLDSISKLADPQVKFLLGGIEVKSKVVENTLNPVFMQRLYLPCISPSLVTNLKMVATDYDTVGKDDFIGSFNFSMEDVQKNLFQKPRWFYIYGAYGDKVENQEVFEYMNLYPDMASRFKG